MAPTKIHVVLCEASNFEGQGNFVANASTTYTLDTPTSFKALREKIAKDFDIDDIASYNIALHVPDDCTTTVLPSMMDSYQHFDEAGNPNLHAHIEPISESTSRSLQTTFPSSATAPRQDNPYSSSFQPINAPSNRGIFGVGPLMNPVQGKRKRSPPDDNRTTITTPGLSGRAAAKQSTDSNLKYIRLGTSDWTRNREAAPDTLPIDEIIVAEVNINTRAIRYLVVDTWAFNGLQIGTGELSQTLDLEDLIEERYAPDPQFLKHPTGPELELAILDLVDRGARASSTKKGKAARSKQLQTNPAYPHPTKPICVYKGVPPQLQASTSTKNVHAVVFFKNRTGIDVHLGIGTNLQFGLNFDETYEEFKATILDGDGSQWDGLIKILAKVFEGPWDVDIFAMPQVANSSTMWSWTLHSDRVASEWVDAAHEEDFGRYIYIEVHVIENMMESGTLKTKTNEDESGDTVVARPKLRTRKRLEQGTSLFVQSDDEEDGEGE